MNILVRKRTNGNGRLVKGRDVIQDVTAVYMSGQVRTSSGDVWTAKASTKGGVDLEAVL